MPPLPWKRYLLSGLVAAALYTLVPASLGGALLYGGIAVSSVIATLAGVRRYRPPRPWGWRLLAIGLAWLVIGDLAFVVATGGAARPPATSAADIFYLIGYPFLAAGLLTLAPRGRAMFDLGEAIDAAILVVGAGVLLWLGVIAPIGARVAADPWAQRLALAYPLADLVLLVIAIDLALVRSSRTPAAWLLVLGTGAQLAADLLFAPSQIARTYRSGNPIDLGWLAAYLAFGLAAMHPSMRRVGALTIGDGVGLTRRRFAVLAATAFVAPLLLLLDRAVGLGGAAAAIAIASSILFVLAMLRLGQSALALDAALRQSRAMKAALGRERDLLQTVLEQLPDAVYIKDAASRFVRLNSAAARTLGLDDPTAALGKTDFDFFPAELAAQYFVDEQRVVASGQPILNKLEPQSLDPECAAWWLTSSVAWRDDQGDVVGIIGVGRDITERRRWEEALQASEGRLRALLSAVPDLVFRLDARGAYLDIKADRPSSLAAPAAALLGRTMADVLPADVADRLLSAIGRVLASGDAETVEYRLELAAGVSDFEARIVAFAPEEVVVVVRDITERKEGEAALVQAKDAAEAANEAKSRFLSTMSHELRTPLQAILGYAELLQLEQALAPPQQDDVRAIERGAQQLIALVDDVLDLSRIEAGRVDVTLEPIAVATVVDQVLANVRPLAAAKGLTVSAQLPSDLPPVAADQKRLRQILLNLAGNAVKFTERGTITISACADAGRIAIAVADTGIGIAPEALPHIFDEFQQADSSLSRRYGGTGLGLAISNRLAALQGGAIRVDSEPGRGSTFTLTLPTAR